MYLNLRERYKSYKELFEPVSYAFYYLHKAIFSSTSINTSYREHAFAEWYKELGHNFVRYEATTPLPRLVSSASGLVVELGPATGNSLQYYSPQRVTQVFGVEPNPDFVVPLRKRLSEVGRDLEEKYTLIVSGIEDTKVLNYYAVVEESIDTVVCMQVLCCVKNRPEVVRKAWELLKPGGMLVFWEHNESSDWLTRNMQGLWNLVWPFAIGGCTLGIETAKLLLKNGDWEIVELGTDAEPWALLPRVWGRLRKVEKGKGSRVFKLT